MKKFLILFSFLLPGLGGLGQLHPILESFGARQVENRIRLDFGIKGGAQCNGVQLERRKMDGTYITVGEISGVCGGSEFTEFYHVDDSSPLPNQINTYRLVLGSQGRSAPVDILFTPVEGDILVYPNPTSGELNLRWNAPDGEPWTLEVVDFSGKVVVASVMVTAPFEKLSLPPGMKGMYQLLLRETVSGRILATRILMN